MIAHWVERESRKHCGRAWPRRPCASLCCAYFLPPSFCMLSTLNLCWSAFTSCFASHVDSRHRRYSIVDLCPSMSWHVLISKSWKRSGLCDSCDALLQEPHMFLKHWNRKVRHVCSLFCRASGILSSRIPACSLGTVLAIIGAHPRRHFEHVTGREACGHGIR